MTQGERSQERQRGKTGVQVGRDKDRAQGPSSLMWKCLTRIFLGAMGYQEDSVNMQCSQKGRATFPGIRTRALPSPCGSCLRGAQDTDPGSSRGLSSWTVLLDGSRNVRGPLGPTLGPGPRGEPAAKDGDRGWGQGRHLHKAGGACLVPLTPPGESSDWLLSSLSSIPSPPSPKPKQPLSSSSLQSRTREAFASSQGCCRCLNIGDVPACLPLSFWNLDFKNKSVKA